MAGKRKRASKATKKFKKFKKSAKKLSVALASAGLRSGGWVRNSTKQLAVERKYTQSYSQLSSGAASNQVELAVINGLPVGSNVFDRVGRRVHFDSLYYKIAMYNPANGPLATNWTPWTGRFIVFVDMQPNAALASITDLLDYVPANYFTAPPLATVGDIDELGVLAPLNLNNRERFRILVDKLYHFEPKNVISGFDPSDDTFQLINPKGVQVYQKFKRIDIDTTYNAATTSRAIDSIQTNAIYIAWITDITATDANDRPRCSVMTRLRYTDA